MSKAKIEATKAAIYWLNSYPEVVYDWDTHNDDFKREYQQIIDDLRVTLRNYEYAQSEENKKCNLGQ